MSTQLRLSLRPDREDAHALGRGRRRQREQRRERGERRPRASQGVDRVRQAEVGLGEAALAVVGQRQAHLVPAVDEDVGVVVALLGDPGHAR